MKPNFALNLSNDSISLLHRTARGWLEIGTTPQDAPDLAEALNYLRRSALGLAPHGVATKLIIPEDQILYLEVSAPGPTDTHREAQIRTALEGRTPYPVEDLVFDWCGDGPHVQVAVIARETLQEAEGFATEFRFNPVSFVAMPDPARFAGEPWFGLTDFAATLLQAEEQVERDADAVMVVSREAPPRATAPAQPEPPAEPQPEPLAQQPEAEAAEPPPAVQDAWPEIEAVEPEALPDAIAGKALAAPELSVLDVALPAEPEIEAEHPADPVEPAEVTPVETISAPEPELAEPVEPAASLFPEVAHADVSVLATEVLEPAEIAEPDYDEAPYAEVMDYVDEPLPPPVEPRRAPAAPLTPPAHGASAAVPRSYATEADDMPPALAPSLQAAMAEARENGRSGSPLAAPPRPPKSGKPAKPATGSVTAPGISGPGARAGKSVTRATKSGRVDVQAAAQTLVAPPPDAAQGDGFRMTRPAGRGRPRHMGLILTGLLLLALAAIAAWSSITLSRNQADAPTTATAELSAPAPADRPAIEPSIEDEALADGQDPAALEPEAPPPAPVETAAKPVAPQATTGETALAAPDAPLTGQDDIVLSTMDAPPAAGGSATVAAAPGAADGLPTAPLPPPPFGTQYVFDADGLIRPTPEGIVTPEGVRLVAGRPPLVPPARPESIAARAAAAAPEAATPAVDPAPAAGPLVTPEGVPVAPYTDPATQGSRPRPRPPELRTEVPADSAADIPADQRMTSLVPRSRPAAISAAFAKAEEQRRLDEEARKVAEAASLSAAAAAQELAAASQAEAAQAQPAAAGPVAGGVGISRLPPSKPRNFDRRVQAALAAALTPRAVPDPEPEAAPAVQQTSRSTTTAEPGEDEEGAPAASAPKIPTKASVSQQATFANAINLGRTNLIGVYGSPSRRYALIRTSSGSFKKVRVGDRIDGGTIAAITDSEVRYQKGGRLVALTMPKG